MKRGAKVLGALLLLLTAGLAVTGFVLHEDRPEGETGPRAEALAHLLVESVDGDAWARTRAVQWTFRGANRHVWDRDAGLAWVRWDDVDVRIRLDDHQGLVTRAGRPVDEPEASALRETAYAHWVNDSFWLNPVTKIFDDGVTRSIVNVDGERGLLASYGGGGLTPGDAYMWIPSPTGRPKAWRMWVSIIPIGGLETSWEGWRQLETGAWIATRHRLLGVLSIDLSDVAGATDMASLLEDDPFRELR